MITNADERRSIGARHRRHVRAPSFRAEAVERRMLLAAQISASMVDTLAVDLDGDGRAKPGDTIQYTATVSNSGDVDAEGVSFEAMIDVNTTQVGGVKRSAVANRDSYLAAGNTQLVVNSAAGLRANDVDLDGVTSTAGLVVTAGTFATTAGGQVAIAADGSFTYTPQLGDQNLTDTFIYSITDGDGLVATGTASINLGQRVWYVDSAYAGGNGASTGESHRPYTTLAEVDGAAGSDAAGDIIYVYERSGDYANGINLLANQQFVGGGASLTVNKIPIAAAGTRTTLSTGNFDAINMAGGNVVKGFAITTSGGTGIRAAGVAGGGVIDNVSVTASGAGAGISLTNCTGSFTITGTTNTIFTATGTALMVSDTPIGAAGLTFQSISANGAVNGIFLSNTGALGGLTVTGTGTTRSSGGVIQNTSLDGVVLANTQNVSLTNLRIAATGRHGMSNKNAAGAGLGPTTNLTLTRVDIVNAGPALDEGAFTFDTAGANNLLGNVAFIDTVIDQHNTNGIDVENDLAGTLNLTVQGASRITGKGKSFANGGSGIALQAGGTATMNLRVLGTDANNRVIIEQQRISGIAARSMGTGSTVNVKVDLALIQQNASGGGAVVISAFGGNSNLATFNLTNNQLLGNDGANISILAADSARANGFVTGNTINANPSNTIPNPSIGRGIELIGDGGAAQTGVFNLTAQVSNSNIINTGAVGIFVQGRSSNSANARVNATVSGNIVAAPSTSFFVHGIQFQSSNSVKTLVAVSGNTSAGATGGSGYRFLRQDSSILELYRGISPAVGVAQVVADNGNSGSVSTGGTPTVGNMPSPPPDPPALLLMTASPPPEQVDSPTLLNTPHAGVAALVGPADLAALPFGSSVQVRYEAQVNSVLPPGTTQVSSQGTITYTGGPANGILTDDPGIAGTSDPTITLLEVDPPATVTEVFVSSTAWSQPFLDFLNSSGVGDSVFGFRIGVTEQLDELPWTNLNRISIRFSENVTLAIDDLVVRGVSNAVHELAATDGFTYDPSTFTATWTLATAGIAADKLLLDLGGDVDFLLRLDVLPGDIDRNGEILASDFAAVRDAQGFTPGSGLYHVFFDVNGSGSILGNDVTLVRNRQGITLPLDEPA